MFISFEGGDASGKTTQIKALAKFLDEYHIPYITTREPGGTVEAEIIREFILHHDFQMPLAEAFLMNAARALHVSKLIAPALQAKKWVLCDRFCDSTYAYQSHAGIDKLMTLHEIATDNLMPDITFIFDIAPYEAAVRRNGQNQELQNDIYEHRDFEFKNKIRENFLTIAEENPERCHVIDASQMQAKISQQIQAILQPSIDNHIGH